MLLGDSTAFHGASKSVGARGLLKYQLLGTAISLREVFLAP